MRFLIAGSCVGVSDDAVSGTRVANSNRRTAAVAGSVVVAAFLSYNETKQ